MERIEKKLKKFNMLKNRILFFIFYVLFVPFLVFLFTKFLIMTGVSQIPNFNQSTINLIMSQIESIYMNFNESVVLLAFCLWLLFIIYFDNDQEPRIGKDIGFLEYRYGKLISENFMQLGLKDYWNNDFYSYYHDDHYDNLKRF